jgi:TRAP-type C4-dicarboxylate transport system permease large subunit
MVNNEIGSITPAVGLNLFVVNAIAPEAATSVVICGSLPYVLAVMWESSSCAFSRKSPRGCRTT